MYPYNSKRKKIRGWKRRVRQVERWGEDIKHPDLTWFEQTGYTYERCTLYRFSTRENRQPPLWFYKRIISKLVYAYRNWTKVFTNMGINYDLQIWLYDPDYIRSEIICYETDTPGETIRLDSEVPANKPFPYNKLADNNYDLNQFDWGIAKDENVCEEYQFENGDFTADDLLKDGYELKFKEDGAKFYIKQFGVIWIGRRKREIKS